MSAEAQTPVARPYVRHLPGSWWLRNRRYFLYMLRDFSPVPFSIWLVWWLVEIGGLRSGSGGYRARMGAGFEAFSIVCFAFAVLHSVTFLKLSGDVLSLPIGSFRASPRLVRVFNFGTWALVSVIILAGYAYLGSLS